MRPFFLMFIINALIAAPAWAHTSNQALVMLLPTEIYIGSGVLAVLLTVLLLAVPQLSKSLTHFAHAAICSQSPRFISIITSLCSVLLLAAVVYLGFFGSRDPLLNPMPLLIWTIWWVGIVMIHGTIGNLWHWINPWTGLFRLINGSHYEPTNLRLPKVFGTIPAIVGFVLFSFFMLAHPAPEDPAILATIVSSYWCVTFVGMLLFGEREWLSRCEFVTILLKQLSRVSIFGYHEGKIHIGFPGWKIQYLKMPPLGLAIFALLLLGTSSFDGLNETFLWLTILDINPLEFPGRSAIVGETITGILAGNLFLVFLFTLCVWAGLRLAKSDLALIPTFNKMSLTILPIAVGYHFAHFLPYFLVNIQYSIATANDPFANGSDILGIGTFYVTTGFFNTRDTVELIFLSQALAVVIGHMVSILAAHIVMRGLLRDKGGLLVSQIPMATFMIIYTFFGLWLLAAPRGA